MDDLDTHRSANLYIDQYGTDAMSEATKRGDVLLMRGDMEGTAVWKRIVKAIAEIQMTEGRTKH